MENKIWTMMTSFESCDNLSKIKIKKETYEDIKKLIRINEERTEIIFV